MARSNLACTSSSTTTCCGLFSAISVSRCFASMPSRNSSRLSPLSEAARARWSSGGILRISLIRWSGGRSRICSALRSEQILDLPPDQRMREILKMPPEDQRALAASLKGDKRDEFLEGMDAKQRETLMALNNPQQVVVDELVQAKLLRAIYSERQLQEVMTDFC